jgi:O-antigen/teichoic acid export membrane protein
MSTFRAAFRGASWALVGQAVNISGQVAYAALTARIFSPSAFGEYVAALSLNALIMLAPTGLASFILKEPNLNRSQVRAINLGAVALGLLGAALFWFVSPVWLDWLKSPGGSEVVPLLTWATFASPIAAVQWALLRRGGDGRSDAAVLTLAFIGAAGVAAVCAILFRETWTLALVAAVNPIILTGLSRALRRAVYPVERRWLAFDWVRFAFRVVTQNSVFFGLRQVPTWSLGATTDSATLGQFSRGNMLNSLPASALTNSLVNGTAPHWRKIETNESRVRAISEAFTLGATAAFVGFAALAALAEPMVAVLLGPGWDLAAKFATWLAIGYAMQVPMTQCGNYLVLTGALSRIRRIQLSIATGLALGVVLSVVLHDFRFLLAGFVLSEISGLVVAAFQVSAALRINPWQLIKLLIAPLISAIGASTVAYSSANLIALGTGRGTILANAIQLFCAAFAVIAMVYLTRKWQPAFAILVARGVLRSA